MTKKEKKQTEWTPEPFPEPRTIPAGWNGAAFENEKPAAEETSTDDWKPEPFPEPRSFPWKR
jgi:hypothetical protein